MARGGDDWRACGGIEGLRWTQRVDLGLFVASRNIAAYIVRTLVRTTGDAMEFEYSYPSPTAKHVASGLVFDVTYDSQTPDIGIRLAEGQTDTPSTSALEQVVRDLHLLVESERLKRRMSGLLMELFSNDFSHAALVLRNATNKKISTRTLQAWVIPTCRSSSRKCPSWAVEALERYAADNPNQAELSRQLLEHQKQRETKSGVGYLSRLADTEAVSFAEAKQAKDEALRRRILNASASGFPEVIADEIVKLRNEKECLQHQVSLFREAIREAVCFDDFKTRVEEKLNELSRFERRISETMEALQNHEAEFATEDGVMPDDYVSNSVLTQW